METPRLGIDVGAAGTGAADGDGARGRLFRFSVEGVGKLTAVIYMMAGPLTWWWRFGGLSQSYQDIHVFDGILDCSLDIFGSGWYRKFVTIGDKTKKNPLGLIFGSDSDVLKSGG